MGKHGFGECGARLRCTGLVAGKRDGRLNLSTGRDDRWFAKGISQIASQIRNQSKIGDATPRMRAFRRWPEHDGTRLSQYLKHRIPEFRKSGVRRWAICSEPRDLGLPLNKDCRRRDMPIQSPQVPINASLIHGNIFKGAFDDHSIEHISVVIIHCRYVNAETHRSSTQKSIRLSDILRQAAPAPHVHPGLSAGVHLPPGSAPCRHPAPDLPAPGSGLDELGKRVRAPAMPHITVCPAKHFPFLMIYQKRRQNRIIFSDIIAD